MLWEENVAIYIIYNTNNIVASLLFYIKFNTCTYAAHSLLSVIDESHTRRANKSLGNDKQAVN